MNGDPASRWLRAVLAPPRRPYFVVLRTHKARFPPSTHLQNLARLWHKKEDRDPWGSEELREEFLRFCTRKNVTEVDRPTLHLAILSLLNEDRPPPIHQQPTPRALTSLRGTEGKGLGSHNEIESQMDAMGISMG